MSSTVHLALWGFFFSGGRYLVSKDMEELHESAELQVGNKELILSYLVWSTTIEDHCCALFVSVCCGTIFCRNSCSRSLNTYLDWQNSMKWSRCSIMLISGPCWDSLAWVLNMCVVDIVIGNDMGHLYALTWVVEFSVQDTNSPQTDRELHTLQCIPFCFYMSSITTFGHCSLALGWVGSVDSCNK